MNFSDIKYNFIIGHGRGGTTLLLYILNAHPQIYGLPEFKNILISKDAKGNEFQSITERYLQRLEKRSFLNNLPDTFKSKKVDRDLYQSAFSNNLPLREKYIRLALSINKVFDLPNRDKTTVTHIIHKVPYYTFYVDEILEIFPEAKFIINIRDPRAQNYSHIKRHSTEKLFLGKSHPEGRSILWNFYAEETLQLLNKYPDKCYLFQYEKFVENPEKIIREILSFLQVPYNESVWNFHVPVKSFLEHARPYLSENKLKKYIPLSAPVTTKYKEDWKKMNPKDIEIIEYVCKKHMLSFGYSPLNTSPSVSLYSKMKKHFYYCWYWLAIHSPLGKYIHKIFQLYFF
ncbi:MAG: hypothetical protein Fur0023_04100 [Bacteroidia bacterium]